MAPTWSERKERERGGEEKERRGERKRVCKWCDSLSRRGSKDLQDKEHRHRIGVPSQRCSFLFIIFYFKNIIIQEFVCILINMINA